MWGAEDDGIIIAAVTKLPGCMDRDKERYSKSEADEGEYDSSVVDPDIAFAKGQWICKGGHGMAMAVHYQTGTSNCLGNLGHKHIYRQ